MARRMRRGAQGGETWAGFVDALSTLLMVLIFALVVFMLAQFFLNVALSGRDAALASLEARVAELADMLALERSGNADLRLELAQLSAQLQNVNSARDEADRARALLAAERDGLAAELAATEAELDRAMDEVEVGERTLELKLGELASLQRDIDALRQLRAELEAEVGSLAAALDESEMQRGAERDRAMALEAELADEAERTLLAQREIEQRDLRLEELAAAVAMTEEERAEALAMSDRRLAQIALLNQQLAALRDQIAALDAALDVSEAQVEADEVQIAELGARLNAALAGKVQELARYRSEFFEKLIAVLGDRTDIKVVGDRFVLQSELLFDSGSAEISAEGRAELDKIAALVAELAGEIPADVPWILRVDGHTDRLPIATAQFPSNWELSTARATAVVRYLESRGVPSDRLAATGFGEFQPFAEDGDLARNRRIEFKLTEQ